MTIFRLLLHDHRSVVRFVRSNSIHVQLQAYLLQRKKRMDNSHSLATSMAVDSDTDVESGSTEHVDYVPDKSSRKRKRRSESISPVGAFSDTLSVVDSSHSSMRVLASSRKKVKTGPAANKTTQLRRSVRLRQARYEQAFVCLVSLVSVSD